MDLLAKFKHIKSGRSGWSNQLCLERKFTLKKSLIWSELTSPPRKKTVELWSGHWLRWNSCWANRKGLLESRAPGFTVCTCTHSASFHAFSAYCIHINTYTQVYTYCTVNCCKYIFFCWTFKSLKIEVKDKSTSSLSSFTHSLETCHYLGKIYNYLITPADTSV